MAKGGFLNKMLDIIGLVDVDDPDDYEYEDEYYDDEPVYDTYEDEPYEEEVAPPPTRPAPVRERPARKGGSKVIDMNNRNANAHSTSRANMKMLVYRPMSYDDTQAIIDELSAGRPVIVNLEELDLDIAQRMLDFMSGAVYAVNGSIFKVANGIFVVAPSSVAIGGNVPDEMQGSSFYFSGARRE